MILVETILKKQFQKVKTEKTMINNLKVIRDFKQLIKKFINEGRIKKRIVKFEKNEFDDIVFKSITFYENKEIYQKCFEDGLENEEKKLKEAGFEINVSIKEFSKNLEKTIDKYS